MKQHTTPHRTPTPRSWLLLPALLGMLFFHHPAWAQTDDTTPPTLVSLNISPPSIDVTASSQDVVFTAEFTDDLSGVSYAYIYLYNPSLSQYYFTYLSQISGNALDGVWQGTVTIPQYVASGTWQIQALYAYDVVGNQLYLGTADLDALGLVNPNIMDSLDVTSNPDTTPPTLVSCQLDPVSPTDSTQAQVDTSTSGQFVTVTFHVTDDLSGIGDWNLANTSISSQQLYVSATFEGNTPTASAYVYCNGFQRVPNPVDGTLGSPLDSYYQTTLWFPQYSPAGIWDLSLTVQDNVGNWGNWNVGDPNIMTQVQVLSTPTDAGPPTVSSLTLTPVTINTSLADATINASVDVQDDLSGVSYVEFYLLSPSGRQSRWLYFNPWDPQNYDVNNPLTRTLTTSLIFPRYSEAGTWKIWGFYAGDQAGWQTSLWGTDIPPALRQTIDVIRPSLTVDGTVNPDLINSQTVADQSDPAVTITFPPGSVSVPTTVAIDVLPGPLTVPDPAGFIGGSTYYVNFEVDPEPPYPPGFPAPGLTIVLPLVKQMVPGTVMDLMRINTTTGLWEPSLDVSGNPVLGTVDGGGWTATFTGISHLSTVGGFLPPFVVSTTADSGSGSLRQAISDANTAGNNGSWITFNNNLGVLTPLSALPALTGLTQIDPGTGNTIGGSLIINGTVTIEGTLVATSPAIVGGGGVLKGNFTLQGPLQIQSGGDLSPGLSPGAITAGDTVWAGGGHYDWEINRADGAEGTDPGWDWLHVTGTLAVTADPTHPFQVKAISLQGDNTPGAATHFSADSDYTWPMATADAGVSGFDPQKFTIDLSSFANDLEGGAFTLSQSGNDVDLKFSANHAPVINDVATYSRSKNLPVKIRISDLLANHTSDPDGDARALVSVVPTTGYGASVTVNATHIIYTPAQPDPNQNDWVSYTIRDVRSAYRAGDTVRTATGWAQITLGSGASGLGYNQISLEVAGGVAKLRFAGIPGYKYAIERTQSLSTPNWVALTPVPLVAPANGIIQFQDTAAPPGGAYYRTAQP